MKFFGEISYWWNSGKDYTNTIDEIERLGYKKMIVRVHCYGGSVFEGNVIWSANRKSKLDITFKIDGIAASMMAIIIQSGNRVEMSSVAKVMVHPPRSNTFGTAKDHFAEGKLLKSMEADFKRQMKLRTKLKDSEVEAMLDGADNWYDAEECVKMGMADAIYDSTEFTTELKGKPDSGTPIDKIFGQYTALATGSITQKKPETMDKKAIIEKFGLTEVTAESSDTAVMEALNKKLEANQNRIKELEGTQASSLATQIDSVIAVREAQLNTKFTDAQKATFKTVGEKSGLEVLNSVLAEVKPTPNLQTLLASGGSAAAGANEVPADRKNWNWDTWEEKDPAGLSNLESTNLEEFKRIYTAKFPTNEARFI